MPANAVLEALARPPGQDAISIPRPMLAIEDPKLDPMIEQAASAARTATFRTKAIEASISRYQVEIHKKIRTGLRLRGVRTAGRASRGAVPAGRPWAS